MLRLNPEVQGRQAGVGAEHSPASAEPHSLLIPPREATLGMGDGPVECIQVEGWSLVPSILIWGGRPGQSCPQELGQQKTAPQTRQGPHLQPQHPANRQFQTSQPSPARMPLPSSYWSPAKGRNNVIGFPISLPPALQTLGGSWRRPPLSIRGWRALIGLGAAETSPRRFLQTLGRETQGGAELGEYKPGVFGV